MDGIKRRRRVRHWTSVGSASMPSVSVAAVVTSILVIGGRSDSLGFAFQATQQLSHNEISYPEAPIQSNGSGNGSEHRYHPLHQRRRRRSRAHLAAQPKSKYLPFGVKWNAAESSSILSIYNDLPSVHNKSSKRLKRKLKWIETTLLEQEAWSTEHVQNLFQTIHSVMADDGRICGLVDFMTTLLDVTSRTTATLTTTITSNRETQKFNTVTRNTRRSNTATTTGSETSSGFVTRDILLASMWHYLDFLEPLCFSDITPDDFAAASTTTFSIHEKTHVSLLPPSNDVSYVHDQRPILVSSTIASKRMITILHEPVNTKAESSPFGAVRTYRNDIRRNAPYPYSRDALDSGVASTDAMTKITRGAEQILRVECLARTIAVEQQTSVDSAVPSFRYQRQSILSNAEATRWRGSMLAVADFDWRSLMIRCVACCYRLESILGLDDRGGLDDGGTDLSCASFDRTPEVVWAAREGMRVYATLAQQLGLNRLKARIEDCAFQILYQRQYRAVTSLYANTRIPSLPTASTNSGLDGAAQSAATLESVSSFLQSRFIDTLFEDSALMSQLESLQVSARVKERFSLWKKLVSKRFKEIRRVEVTEKTGYDTDSFINSNKKQHDAAEVDRTVAWSDSKSMLSSNLSVSDVSDAVALRVILRARKWSEDESEESIRAREQLLCYYVREKLRSQWPALEPNRVKDYIQFPKANGYQSLHYTSKVVDDDTNFPFEVQVRSDEMDYRAEHGAAKHWAYKLGNESIPTAPTAASETMLYLPESDEEGDAIGASRRNPSTANSYLDSLAFASAKPYDRPNATTGNAYLDSLAQVRQLIEKHQVYVFVTASIKELSESTEDREKQDYGKLVSIPSSSTVETAIRSMMAEMSTFRTTLRHTDVNEIMIWRNGRTACLDDAIESGDVLVLSLE